MIERATQPLAKRYLLCAEPSPGPRLFRAARQLALGAIVTLALAFRPPALCGSPPATRHLVIVESRGAAGKIDRLRLLRIVQQARSELHVDESAVPDIVLIHLSNDEARAGGVPLGTSLMVERSFLSVDGKNDARPPRFLVWMVGKPYDQMMVGAVAHVLRLHLQLDISDHDLLLAEERILQRLNSTVDVSSFVKPRQ